MLTILAIVISYPVESNTRIALRYSKELLCLYLMKIKSMGLKAQVLDNNCTNDDDNISIITTIRLTKIIIIKARR